MKRLILCFFIIATLISNAQNCNFPVHKKVLLIGDSWGNFMWLYRSNKESFIKYGYPDYIEEGTNTVENGANSGDFMVNPKLSYVKDALINNPDIDIVLMSLGGNDILGGWNANYSQAQDDSLLDTIQGRLQIIIDTIKQVRPAINILFSGYDYPNFGETTAIVSTGAYANLFHDMGHPTFFQINSILSKLIQRYTLMASADSQLHVVNNLGLMQWVYGQSNNLIVYPYLPAYQPHTVPLPGGDINYPSPMTAMLGNIDAFHISQNAFQYFTNRQTELFFWEQFRKDKDTSFISLGSSLDGYSDANGNIINTQLAIGNKSQSGEVSSILSFNTSNLPDNAIVTHARLFLTRASQSGQNPILTYGADKISVDIKSGHFGNSNDVELTDFNDSADAVNIACLIGTAENNEYKIRFEMSDTNSLRFINTTGITQFRIYVSSFDSLAGNMLNFYGYDTTGTNRPVLDIKYILSPLSSRAPKISSESYSVYPNPTNDKINIKGDNIISCEIIDLKGKIVENISCNKLNPEINLSHLPRGMYLIRIISKTDCYVTKIILQ